MVDAYDGPSFRLYWAWAGHDPARILSEDRRPDDAWRTLNDGDTPLLVASPCEAGARRLADRVVPGSEVAARHQVAGYCLWEFAPVSNRIGLFGSHRAPSTSIECCRPPPD
jgi:hypothetical protein